MIYNQLADAQICAQKIARKTLKDISSKYDFEISCYCFEDNDKVSLDCHVEFIDEFDNKCNFMFSYTPKYKVFLKGVFKSLCVKAYNRFMKAKETAESAMQVKLA